MKNTVLSILASLSLVTFLSSVFTVQETETVFLVQFGRVVKIVNEAGLHFRLPFIQNLISFDRRLNQVDSPAREVIALDQKRLIVDAYAKYKILDPQIFFQTVKDEYGANSRIVSILDSSMRQVVASYPFVTLLSDKRIEMMEKVKDLVVKQTKAFGVKVVDVRIIRADLPIENSEAIFSRMETDRSKEAGALRAEGYQRAAEIQSKADRSWREIISQAKMQASLIQGKADASATRIYASSFKRDPQFFEFYLTMMSYRNSLQKDRTKMILGTKNAFLNDLMKLSKNLQ